MVGKRAAAAVTASAVSPPMFTSQQQVRCFGLQAAPELNGLLCTLISFTPETGRWEVKIQDGRLRNLKPSNLEPDCSKVVEMAKSSKIQTPAAPVVVPIATPARKRSRKGVEEEVEVANPTPAKEIESAPAAVSLAQKRGRKAAAAAGAVDAAVPAPLATPVKEVETAPEGKLPQKRARKVADPAPSAAPASVPAVDEAAVKDGQTATKPGQKRGRKPADAEKLDVPSEPADVGAKADIVPAVDTETQAAAKPKQKRGRKVSDTETVAVTPDAPVAESKIEPVPSVPEADAPAVAKPAPKRGRKAADAEKPAASAEAPQAVDSEKVTTPPEAPAVEPAAKAPQEAETKVKAKPRAKKEAKPQDSKPQDAQPEEAPEAPAVEPAAQHAHTAAQEAESKVKSKPKAKKEAKPQEVKPQEAQPEEAQLQETNPPEPALAEDKKPKTDVLAEKPRAGRGRPSSKLNAEAASSKAKTEAQPQESAAVEGSPIETIDGAPSGFAAWEERLWAEGFAVIAGTDEAGRGPLAGPVVAAAFAVLDHEDAEVRALMAKVNDSKKLTADQRDRISAELTDPKFQGKTAWAIAEASVEEIDETNILQAALLAMSRAVQELKVRPSCVLVDGCNRPPDLLGKGERWTRGSKKDLEAERNQQKLGMFFKAKTPVVEEPAPWRPEKVEAVIEGDGKVPSISAASILAKVWRDQIMESLHAKFPAYGFGSHKGYGTAEHMEAIKKHGICPEHRRSFGPVMEALENGTKPSP